MAKSTYTYVTYIRATPEKVWAALTDVEFIKQYWFGMHCDCTFKQGSPWSLVSSTGETYDTGEILESVPPKLLVIRWQHVKRPELQAEGVALCRIELEPQNTATRLSLTHSIEASPSKFIEAVSGGWPKIMSNLKSLLETGKIALEEAYPPGQSAKT